MVIITRLDRPGASDADAIAASWPGGSPVPAGNVR
jgi:hypothetical protein